jgi:predicted nucleic acid-binding protein
VTAVFADTVYWIALTNPRDKHAQDVGRFDDLLSGGRVYTTEEVLAELLTFFAGDSWLRSRAVETVREILSDPAVHVIPQSHESFIAGFELYRARPDKEYSLADCISMQTMRKEGLTEVLTNDRHFEQEGFRALFRDS